LDRPISAPHAAAVQYSNGTSAAGRAAANPPRIGAQPALEFGPVQGQPAQAVIARPPVHAPRAIFQLRGPGQVVRFGFLGLLLQERIGVLGKAARRRQQQAPVIRALGQQALDQLETERGGCPDQLGVVVGGERGAPLGDRVADAVHGELAHRASAEREQRCRQHQAALRGGDEVHRTNADIALKWRATSRAAASHDISL
jgi:hypothetical protein